MILIYLLKVSACTMLFFGVYQLCLAKLTFFNLNRIYLLLMLLVCFTIPSITVKSIHEVNVAEETSKSKVVYSKESSFEQDALADGNSAKVGFDLVDTLTYCYATISVIFLLRWLVIFFYINNQLRKYAVTQHLDVLLVHPQSTIKNCSFFNTIVIDSDLSSNERDLVIMHERVHVQQWHALDKVLISLATVVLWFNPVIYFWRNAIDHNHEFLADHELSKKADKNTYASLLLSLAMPIKNYAVNSFSKLPLKNRIMTMYKEPNSKLQKLSYLLIVPAVLISSLAFVNREDVEIRKPNAITNQMQAGTSSNSITGYADFALNLNPGATSTFKTVDLVLVVDAGHGGKDAASVALDGQREKDMNLRAVKILREEASKRGIKVILTRDNDQFLSLRDRLPQQKATAFISIHHNATGVNQAPSNGIEVYVSKLNSNIKVAEKLGAGILDKLKGVNGIEVKNALKDANLLLLSESKVPAVLIELGNISNESNLKFINQEQNIRKVSNLILDGFVSFVKTSY